MWNDLPAPVVVGHRGDKAYAPENTISAFKQAGEKGADAVEFDVKLSADGHVIVLHDQTVDRTTNGTGNAAKITLAVLRELDASMQFSGQFPGERIPTLEEVFETVGKQIYMNVELTNYSTPNDGLVSKVAELVKKHGMQSRVLFSSFLAHNLQKVRLALPEVPHALLTLPGLLGFWGRTIHWHGDYAALNPYITDINSRLITRIHSTGKRVNAWTVNSEEEIKRTIDLGVDGIISDDPGLVVSILGRSK